jgi:hypothetical protein
VDQALDLEYDGVTVRVMRPEHLIALYIRAGGADRRERAVLLKRAGVVDDERLADLLERYHLTPSRLSRNALGSARRQTTLEPQQRVLQAKRQVLSLVRYIALILAHLKS